jgi:hypothetical protein
MLKPRHDELRSYLAWRRQTRFIRRHGGPILALTLFLVGIAFVWRAYHTRTAVRATPRIEEKQSQEYDRHLQAAKLPRW